MRCRMEVCAVGIRMEDTFQGYLDMGHRRGNRTYETLNVGRIDVYATKARIKDIS